MEKMNKLFFGLLILSIISSQIVHSSPVESDNDDDDYLADKSSDSYDEEYTDDVVDEKKASTASTSQAAEEQYTTEEYTEKAEAGKTVVLKCLGDGLDETFLYMWYNGSAIIAQGDATVSRGNDRISFSKKDGLLTIKDVSSFDDGIFRCRAFSTKTARFETIIHVNIRGPPRGIVIGQSGAKQNIIGDTLTYKAGEKNLRFKCSVAKARPEAKIDWVHNGNTILETQQKDHDLKIEDEGVLVIKNLHARHAGDYHCEASNEFGNLKASFKIEVKYQPFFMHHLSYFNAEEGGDVELHCLYKAFPAPISIKWLKGGNKIHENDKYKINNDVHEHHDRTKLLIRDVEKKDMILYTCEIENELGVRTENITMGDLPAPARFEGYKYINNIVYTDWIIKSHQTLTELQILYRNNAVGWRPKNAHITNMNPIKEGEWKVQGSIELNPGDWIIMARSKNTEGWSDDRFSQEVSIKIPKDSLESQNQTSSAPATVSMMSGLILLLLLHRFA